MKNIDQKYDRIWVGLLVVKDRKILMTRERGNTLFQLPGGTQDKGESYLDTLRREINEELGVEIKHIETYDDFVMPGRHEGTLIRFIIYTADINEEIKPGDDIEEIKWIDSKYGENMIDIGNPTRLRLIPNLVNKNVID